MRKNGSVLLMALLICACSRPTSAPQDDTPSKEYEDTAATITTDTQPSETLIPRSISGDKGKYYLLSANRNGDIVFATHKRIGVDSVGFTQTETNCSTMKMREIGYSEVSAEEIKKQPTDWFDLVEGSSKSDLANFICKK